MAGAYYIMDKGFYSWHGQSGSLVINKNYEVVGLIDLGFSGVRYNDASGIVLLSVGQKQSADASAKIYD
ncbi:hypothetical protein FACS1894152_7470 [Bacilli bacterium]|nr:hypothetical protein FACS1894152_7470 [Bacilli bacterium]